jgi:hypothetical protein
MVDVVPDSITHAPSLLHHNDVGVTYPTNLRMELIKFVPLHFMAMPQSMVAITKAPFVTTLVHIVVNMRYRP